MHKPKWITVQEKGISIASWCEFFSLNSAVFMMLFMNMYFSDNL